MVERDVVGNLVVGQVSTRQGFKGVARNDDSMSTFEQSLNPQTNRLRQQALKKQKKQQLKAQMKAASGQGNGVGIDGEESDADMEGAFGAFRPLPQ